MPISRSCPSRFGVAEPDMAKEVSRNVVLVKVRWWWRWWKTERVSMEQTRAKFI